MNCPSCGSPNVQQRHIGKSIGGGIGAVAGGMASIEGASAGAVIGSAIPIVGTLAGGILVFWLEHVAAQPLVR